MRIDEISDAQNPNPRAEAAALIERLGPQRVHKFLLVLRELDDEELGLFFDSLVDVLEKTDRKAALRGARSELGKFGKRPKKK
jgi:hypothetical protein